MATRILDLKDSVVTDSGEVIIKYHYLVLNLLLMGKSIEGLKTFKHSYAEDFVQRHFVHLRTRPESDVEYHNRVCEPEQCIKIVELDGVPEEPPADSFTYSLPDKYLDFDIDVYLAEKLKEKFPALPDTYVERLTLERVMMYERGMDHLLRALIYIVDVFDQNNIVYGVGRGSACASLVLYLIGIHMVDPVEYEIPITEFLR